MIQALHNDHAGEPPRSSGRPDEYACPLGPHRGITRRKGGWRARRYVDGKREIREFFDGKSGPEARLAHALAWQSGLDAPKPYHGIDRTRLEVRKLTLIRRVPGGGRTPHPRFELQISASRSNLQVPWMRVFVGSKLNITQERIDEAIGTLHARWAAYRADLEHDPDLKPHHRDYAHIRGSDLRGTELRVEDVLAFNGRGAGVGYSPTKHVDPNRSSPWAPEYDLHRPGQQPAIAAAA